MGERRAFGGKCKRGHPWVPANVKVYLAPTGKELRVCRLCERERGRRRLRDPARRAEMRRLNAVWRARTKATQPQYWKALKHRQKDLILARQYYVGDDTDCRAAAVLIVRLREWLRAEQAAAALRPVE